MRKRLVAPISKDAPVNSVALVSELGTVARVEVTSEEKNIRSSLRLVVAKRGAGGPPSPASHHPANYRSAAKSDASGQAQENETERTKSSIYDGPGMVIACFEKLCASSGFQSSNSVREVEEYRVEPLRSSCLNWSLCPTSVEDRLALHWKSHLCAWSGSERGVKGTQG